MYKSYIIQGNLTTMFKQNFLTKKTGFLLLIIAGLFLMNISFAEAVAWETITDIPGLPAGSEVTLSDFIIVLYDFLLSAVGIAAMFMIVIGGFRYLTAAGNAAALSDAKDIIYSALYGLLLAISTWIIVSTINPDLVYLKQPGANPTHGNYSCLPSGTACNTCNGGDGCKAGCAPADPDCPPVGAIPSCNPGDGCVLGPCPNPDPDCYSGCCSELQTGAPMCSATADGTCQPVPVSCLDPTWPLNGDDGLNCKCIDGATVGLVPFVDCNAACKSSNCYVIDFRIGKADMSQASQLSSDKHRAQTFAIYDSNGWDNPIEIIETCNLYINAADYTTRFSDLILLVIDNGLGPTGAITDDRFDGDCFVSPAPPLLDLLSWNGYYAPVLLPMTCHTYEIITLYTFWDDEATAGRCKRSENGLYVTCPIKMCAKYADGTTRSITKYLKMAHP